MDAQEGQVLEKTASAGCADMYDNTDTITEMEKTSLTAERQVQLCNTLCLYGKRKVCTPT